jgi:hypothetical protein
MATTGISGAVDTPALNGCVLDDVRANLASGDPLDGETRGILERGFGTDLTEIRIHADSNADRLTRLLDTDAFAAGPPVFFRRGACQPRTRAGQGLLAHEVTHSLQQAQRAAYRSWTDREMEDEAGLVASGVLAGQQLRAHGRPFRLTDALTNGPLVIQRHESFEHRALGDVAALDIGKIASRGDGYQDVIDRETRLMWLWHQSPESVTEAQVKSVRGDIGLIRLQPSNLLVTYGELNALPVYIRSAQAIDTCPKEVLLPILQSIRQESYYRLNQLRGKETNDRFALAPFGPHDSVIGLINKVFNSWAMDDLTRDLGSDGRDHYTGLLARNACHFAPYTWYRWQASYLIACDFAKQSQKETDSGKKKQLETAAWTYHGYADHFLQDSFAAGHLINKTLVMQWFIKWAAGTWAFIEDWDAIKNVTQALQPGLGSRQLYKNGYAGLGTDPQTVEEQPTYDARLKLSGVQAYTADNKTVDQATAYQHYLTFLSSVIAQTASNALHDAFNERSVWVASDARPQAYEVYGDDTLFTGKDGAAGAQITSEVAQLSQQSIRELLKSGQTAITTEKLRQNFPTKAGNDAKSVVSLEDWAFGQEQWTIDNVFNTTGFLAKRAATQAFPRILNFAQDLQFANEWSTSLPNSGYHFTDVKMSGERLFFGSHSMLYELDPNNGSVKSQKQVTNAQDETHIATDGSYVFTGVYGYVRATNLNNWAAQAWAAPMPGLTSWPVNLLLVNNRLFAGSNGFLVEIDPRNGNKLHTLTLSDAYGPDVRMASDGEKLYAGSHGYLYAVNLNDMSKVAWTAPMTGASYSNVQPLCANGMLFAGSNGTVHMFDRGTGARTQTLVVSAAVDEEVRLTLTDRRTLVAGCHGYAYGINLNDWSKVAWTTPMAGKLYTMVDVAYYGGHIYACSNGYIQRLDAATGAMQNSMQLSFILGSGDYTPALTIHPRHGLFIGMHGYGYNVLL